ncbi:MULTISPECIES: DEAD/DEAH box helicase [unclassified Mesorhizobium]|uniref:DEAD/DEAH box helicase n=2 Tax=Mesorhizobium TaxID=68287 RepID=UPI000FCC91AA|nr:MULTISPECIES: DEAD/DEAH box helicase [unclassified Mesorhizobium]TGP21981.1 DEAD/DEAH box helicase [Mesorhizobium sp. M1D.F.Ca.ET.231.01.1.1]TGP30366.1 DEAD/DEAH box helicase [Mesorhizobium sp. M1D.F.Ca.ET.234.01.1.1]TGS44442.1 DEAD/DEAH box helicase [Mesorhizobium sp. M1D.F.Ca.ET.184.01.1.1]TGS60482.1 DEAD/DEAH box helicase [Mesorhizobium sp. M1D.F.Ca.ET.183.01.1.1]
MSSFDTIVPALAEALEKRGYAALTPVQQAVLAPELGQADALVSAQTGSGKTVAFGLAMAPTLLAGAERFAEAGAPLGLIVAPTRELALQVRRELEWLYELTGATVASCVGGMDMRSERRALERGANIVVGTPGRLRDHITRGALDMSALKVVVLDEADEMLDLGFREDLEFILDAAPAERRTLMFSATVPRSITTLAKSYQRDAVRISAGGEERQHLDIEYRALSVAPADRENAIINVLRYYEATNAMVFCNTRAAVNHLTARFNNRNFSVVALSGELSQNERSHALQAMRDGRARVCIATDVAARGIDLPNLDLVIHADLPTNPETLLHRSGRTGRAGRKGVSALIVPGNARRRTERLLNNAGLTAAWASPPSADEVLRRDDERILADPAFGEPVKDEERDFATALLARHGAELVAAAFVRLCRGSRSAPEDLLDVAPFAPSKEKFSRREEAPGRRDDFGDSVWFSLSVGRRQNAEPRWLIPMLCRTGGISKREIGAIKMQPEETFVQIAADWADRFLAAIGPDRKLQGNIAVRRLDGTPDLSRAGYQPPKPEKRPHRGKRAFDQDAPGFEKRAPSERKPAGAPDSKPWAKKPGKAKFEKAGPTKHKKARKRPG